MIHRKLITKLVNNGLTNRLKYCFIEPPNFDSQKNYFEILEVPQDAQDSDIKKSYFRLAKLYHPDSNKGFQNKFKQISQAYNVLSNPQLKKDYLSARYFHGFTSRMGSKFSDGDFNMKEDFANMTDQEKEFMRNYLKFVKRIILFGIAGFFIFLLMMSRDVHRHFVEQGGKLVPVDVIYTPQGIAYAPVGTRRPTYQEMKRIVNGQELAQGYQYAHNTGPYSPKYVPSSQQYAPSSQQQYVPSSQQQYVPSSQQYVPSQQYAPSSQQYSPSSQQYSPSPYNPYSPTPATARPAEPYDPFAPHPSKK